MLWAQAIVFTSQQSRFHLETIEAASKDLDILGVQLSVGDTKLLEDAQLRLFSGEQYRNLEATGFSIAGAFITWDWQLWHEAFPFSRHGLEEFCLGPKGSCALSAGVPGVCG